MAYVREKGAELDAKYYLQKGNLPIGVVTKLCFGFDVLISPSVV